MPATRPVSRSLSLPPSSGCSGPAGERWKSNLPALAFRTVPEAEPLEGRPSPGMCEEWAAGCPQRPQRPCFGHLSPPWLEEVPGRLCRSWSLSPLLPALSSSALRDLSLLVFGRGERTRRQPEERASCEFLVMLRRDPVLLLCMVSFQGHVTWMGPLGRQVLSSLCHSAELVWWPYGSSLS